MSSCSLPVESAPYGGHCRQPVSSCLDQSTTPELSTHLHPAHVSASESAFSRRFDPIPMPQSTHTPQHKQRGGSKRRRRRRQRRRSLKNNASRRRQKNTRQRRRRRSLRNRKRGGDGFRFDLSACPSGGMPDTVRYSTNVSDFY